MIKFENLSEYKLPTYAKESFDYIVSEIGPINNSNLKSLLTVLTMTPQKLEEKINFLRQRLNLSNRIIAQNIFILNLGEENIRNKIVFLKEFLEFSNYDLEKSPKLLSLSYNTMVSKYRFYSETLGFKKQHIKHYPKLFDLDCESDESKPTSVRAKIKFFQDVLGYSNKQFQNNPTLLNYDCISGPENPTSIQYKIAFYQKHLGFELKDFQNNPKCFDYDCAENTDSKTSVLSKIQFFRDELGFPTEILKKNFALIRLDPNVVTAKIKVLNEIGFSVDDIKNDVQMLNMPVKDIKDKYVLWCIISPDKQFLQKNKWYVTSPEKIYARYRYLTSPEYLSTHKPVPHGVLLTALNRGELEFKKRFGASSESIMELYPYDEKTIAKLYGEYKSLGIQPAVQRGNVNE